MARGGPQFKLGVARRAQLQQIVVAAVVNLEAGDALRVAAIETFRQTQNRGQRSHRARSRFPGGDHRQPRHPDSPHSQRGGRPMSAPGKLHLAPLGGLLLLKLAVRPTA